MGPEHRTPGIPRKVGLALGSGSARGWAHIGVVQALADAGIQVDYVAGTSIGALVGAVFASGRIDDLRDFVLRIDWKQVPLFLDVVWPRSGLIDGRKVTDFAHKYVQQNIEELPLPFAALSTDLATGDPVVMRQGDVVEAIRASISVPGVFTPVKRDGLLLVDGGLVSPVPVRVVRQMGADFVIAVDLNHDTVDKKGINTPRAAKRHASVARGRRVRNSVERSKMMAALKRRIAARRDGARSQIRRWRARASLPNIFEVLLASTNIMQAQIGAAQLRMDPPDILIQPEVGHLKFLEFNRGQEAIDEGYREAEAQIRAALG